MIGVIIGALIAIGFTLLIEWLRMPWLELKIAPVKDIEYKGRKDIPAKQVRYLHVMLVNRPFPRWASWLMRKPALQCHGIITFHGIGGKNIFGKSMPIRWSSQPVPVPMFLKAGEVNICMTDPSWFTLRPMVDIYPGEHQLLDVAARFDHEDDGYGWTNENYFSNPVWRNPHWKLPSGQYIVKITVFSAGGTCTGLFRLVNDVSQENFRLVSAEPTDTARG